MSENTNVPKSGYKPGDLDYNTWMYIMLLVVLPYYFISIIWYYKRSHKSPIKLRKPKQVIGIGMCFAVMSLNIALREQGELFGYNNKIDVYRSINSLCVAQAIYYFIKRCWSLWINFGIANNRIEYMKWNSKRHYTKNRTTVASLEESLASKSKSNNQGTDMSMMTDNGTDNGGSTLQKSPSQIKKTFWFLTHQQFGSKACNNWFYLSWMSFCLLAIVPLALIYDPQLAQFYGTLLSGVGVITMIVFAFALRNKIDNFGIHEELKNVGLAGVIGLGTFVGVDIATNNEWISGFVSCVWSYPVVVVVMVNYPTYLSYKPSENVSSSVRNSSKNKTTDALYKLVESEQGYVAFQSFLITEFSVENILFWQNLQLIKKKWLEKAEKERDEAKQKESDKRSENPAFSYHPVFENNFQRAFKHTSAKDDVRWIYTHYISSQSQFGINLPSGIVDKIETLYDSDRKQHLNDASLDEKIQFVHDIFREAEQEIVTLMIRDSYRRFKKSDLYTSFNKIQEVLNQDVINV